jgi:N-sulfoglucosamine sulfohydrolase
MKATNDPLLKGPVPLPPGGRTTPVNEINPKPEKAGVAT